MKRSLQITIPIAAAVLLALTLRATLLDFFVVEGRSMEPTLRDGSIVMIWKPAYAFSLPFVGRIAPDPERGDMVVATSPLDGKRVVKRIAWVGPERLRLSDDGRHLAGGGSEVALTADQARWFGSGVLVPDGWVFVVGDNDSASVDSRDYGCVKTDSIEGKVILIQRNDGK